MSLVDLIAAADERALAASGLACLDRCVPLLGGDDEVLRPLWGSLSEAADPADWSALLKEARTVLEDAEAAAGADPAPETDDEPVVLARRMLQDAPADRTGDALRAWAHTCSAASLRVHALLDPAEDPAPVDDRRAGRTDDMPPLVAAELRRQAVVLDVLAEHGPAGLRRALEVTVEGRRVLRAVVSRRARGRG
ncbi:hypothetical protein ACIQPQ_05575 [Streptomyces sp. NPDC091281]|uniref:hypothetical protein n=1 Tax=Streptomyces sp. NPDC091281 TaxID=3365985 RepID=UPI003812ED9A